MNENLEAVKRELVQVAGERRAEVQTLAGWTSIDLWNPYGCISRPQAYVEFYLDLGAMCIRERAANRLLSRLIPDDKAIFGCWPIRFVPSTDPALPPAA